MTDPKPAVLRCVLFAFVVLSAGNGAAAATLYDAALGTLPSAQGWVTPVAGSQSVAGGSLTIDTTAMNAIQVSNLRTDIPLDPFAGYFLDVTLKVVSESHEPANNRAGFSIINIGSNPTYGLEIAFWEDEVWFYDADFNRTNPVSFAGGVFHDFRFRFENNLVDVVIDGVLRASNLPLYDYCPPAASCSFLAKLVYDTPSNFVFGDDTTSAAANVMIRNLAITPVPLPAGFVLLASAAAALVRYRRS